MISEGTVVAWLGNRDVEGIVVGSIGKKVVVKLDEGCYDPDTWPDGIRNFNPDEIEVVK